MPEMLTGLVRGNTIMLDAEIPPLEGHRVRLVVEPLDESEVVLSPEESARLWTEWADNGPQGPIDDVEPDFP